MPSGADVHRQAMEALVNDRPWKHEQREGLLNAAAALAPCFVLTPEEAAFIRRIVRGDLRPEWKRELDRILTPEAPDG